MFGKSKPLDETVEVGTVVEEEIPEVDEEVEIEEAEEKDWPVAEFGTGRPTTSKFITPRIRRR